MKAAAALQFYYTSCRRGLSGYAGFQTRAESSGLQLDERRQLEGKALYQPPRDLPPEPDADAIAGQFPKAFKAVWLLSGRAALIRSTYAGQDYSGRWGNYFAHGLVIDGPLGDLWTIDAYAWPGWVDRLGEESEDADPVALPEVPIAEIGGSSDFAFEELQTFLGEGDSRPRSLAQMLNAVFRATQDSRSLVIREQSEMDGVYWIACVLKAFPCACQRDLSFSTYQFDPRSALRINATNGATDFLFDEAERKYQFYMFDFVTGLHSDVTDENPEYASQIAEWMASTPQRLYGFHEFATLFECGQIGGHLVQLLRLYRIASGDRLMLATRDLYAILAFVNEHAKPAAFARVLLALGDVTRSLDANATLNDWVMIIRFLANGAASAGGDEHRSRVCRTWVDAFDHFVFAKRQEEAQVVALRGEVEAKLGSHAIEVARAFLTDEHLDWMWQHAPHLSAKSLSVIMNEVIGACRQIRLEPAYESQEVRSLLESVLSARPGRPPDLAWAFAPFRSDVIGLSSLVEHVLALLEEQIREGAAPREVEEAASRAVGRSLAAVLGPESDGLRYRVINHLKLEEKFTNVLVGEWEEAMSRANDRVESHARYERNVLLDESAFALKMRGEFAATLVTSLPPEQQRRQARQWVESGGCKCLSDAVARTVLSFATEDVKLPPDDAASDRLALKIQKELNTRGLRIDSDRLELRAAARRVLAERGRTADQIEVVGRADAASYREFVGVVLPRLLAAIDTPDGHRNMLTSIFVEAHRQVFARAYDECLGQRPKDRFERADVAALVFWLRLSKSDAAWSTLQRLKKPALEVMAVRLGAVRGKARSVAEANLEQLAAQWEPAQRRELQTFLDRAEELRPSLLSRLFGRGRS